MEYERKETGSLKNKIQKEFYSLLISNLELNQVKRERGTTIEVYKKPTCYL